MASPSFSYLLTYLEARDFSRVRLHILKNENNAHLKTVKKIDELYENAQADILGWGEASKIYDKMLEALPQEACL